MSNMSYCRFRNTLLDLADCQNVMFEEEDIKDLSPEEDRARQQLINLCHEISQVSEDEFDEMLEVIYQKAAVKAEEQ